MVDIIGQNPLFTSAIRLIMAQRLIRRLDDSTKIAYQPDQPLRMQLQKIIDSLPSMYKKPDISNLTLYKPGSSAENPFGFKGQIAIREQMVMSDALRALLMRPSAEISTQMIEETAVQAGMLTMLHSALFKLLSGETTVEEVFRVLG
jgi:type II secretory ATPase GspE/PulE/Tfp pilus assembly ATPase PilB-like protein